MRGQQAKRTWNRLSGATRTSNSGANKAWNNRHQAALEKSNNFVAENRDGDVEPRVLEKLDKRYWAALKRGDHTEAQRIKEQWEAVEDGAIGFIPVVGSAKEAYEQGKEGNIGSAVLHGGLAVAEGVGVGLMIKGVKAARMAWRGRKVVRAVGGTNVVYQGLDAAGKVRYVGITSRQPAVRFAEHLGSGTNKSLLRFEAIPGASNLSRTGARVWEQRLINQYGLGNNGGQLFNRINSISPTKWHLHGIK